MCNNMDYNTHPEGERWVQLVYGVLRYTCPLFILGSGFIDCNKCEYRGKGDSYEHRE